MGHRLYMCLKGSQNRHFIKRLATFVITKDIHAPQVNIFGGSIYTPTQPVEHLHNL